ncbi:MAG: aminoacyl-tRNA hydrolase [Bulleidia sp.]
MKLIVGLGNPGKEYEKTRHNSGFIAIDRLAKDLHAEINTQKWNARIAKLNVHGESVILMKPQTYMNESGSAVALAVRFFNLDPEAVLILHDDMDLPVGAVRIRKSGSSGGQKGMQSILNALHTEAIPRIRIGVGHSHIGQHHLVPDWVLSGIPKTLQPEYDTAISFAANAAEAWIYQPLDIVMSRYNRKPARQEEAL